MAQKKLVDEVRYETQTASSFLFPSFSEIVAFLVLLCVGVVRHLQSRVLLFFLLFQFSEKIKREKKREKKRWD